MVSRSFGGLQSTSTTGATNQAAVSELAGAADGIAADPLGAGVRAAAFLGRDGGFDDGCLRRPRDGFEVETAKQDFRKGLLIRIRLGTLVVKTLAVRPDRAYAGLGALLLGHVHRNAAAMGLRRAVHALMHVSNQSRALSGHWRARQIRRYALFARVLSS